MTLPRTRPHRTALLVGGAAAVVAAIGLSAAALTGSGLQLAGAADGEVLDPGAQSTAGAVGSSGTTGITMTVTNSTGYALTLNSANAPHTSWDQQPGNLALGASETVKVHSSNDDGSEIDLVYTASDGTTISLKSTSPYSAKHAEAIGTTTNPIYTVAANTSNDHHATSTFTLYEGRRVFTYTGTASTYTVPPGATQVSVDAYGGSGGGVGYQPGGYGAEIKGTLAVTPGETLTVAPAGLGQGDSVSHPGGGWGMTVNGNDYGGGAGQIHSNGLAGAGGGATVVLDGSGAIVLVAGGGGAACYTSMDQNSGGSGGEDGSMTGQNGGGYGGGQAGGAATSMGQAAPAIPQPGGAGGGGVNGGAAGQFVETNEAGGGGAGSSSAPGLSSVTVAPSGITDTGQVTINPIWN